MNTNASELKSVAKLAKALIGINLSGGPNPLITSKGRSSTSEQKVKMVEGDWVRVRRGPLEGAEGRVEKLSKVSDRVTVVEIKQLNGNTVRLPRAHFEFAAFGEPGPDRL